MKDFLVLKHLRLLSDRFARSHHARLTTARVLTTLLCSILATAVWIDDTTLTK